jgi:hypothetical protein
MDTALKAVVPPTMVALPLPPARVRKGRIRGKPKRAANITIRGLSL